MQSLVSHYISIISPYRFTKQAYQVACISRYIYNNDNNNNNDNNINNNNSNNNSNNDNNDNDNNNII